MSISQASDPWGRASPATDPWNTNTGAISRQPPIPSLAGASSAARNHSPSVASGSSTEDWLHSAYGDAAAVGIGNGNGNGNAPQLSDPWLSKPPQKPEQPDPWLSKAPETNTDAWQPTKSAVVDPWAPSNIGVCSSFSFLFFSFFFAKSLSNDFVLNETNSVYHCLVYSLAHRQSVRKHRPTQTMMNSM